MPAPISPSASRRSLPLRVTSQSAMSSLRASSRVAKSSSTSARKRGLRFQAVVSKAFSAATTAACAAIGKVGRDFARRWVDGLADAGLAVDELLGGLHVESPWVETEGWAGT